MAHKPEVSVLLPARNGGTILREAIESILAQTYDDLELIVIDDDTTDGSLADLPEDARLRIIRNPARGIVAALNAGACLSQGRYLARMDGDDFALPERIERQIALLESEPDLGIVGAQVEIFTDGSTVGDGFQHYETWINSLLKSNDIRREIFVESPIPHPTAVFRADVFHSLGGYRNVPWAEDYDLWLRAFQADIPMAKPDGVLLRWRDRSDRLSRTDPLYSLERFTRAKAHFLARTLLCNRSAVIWGAAPTGAMLHDALVREGVVITAFIDIDPRKIGGRKRGKPVLGPDAAGTPRCELLLGAVGTRGAREKIRAALTEMGKHEGTDFLFTA